MKNIILKICFIFFIVETKSYLNQEINEELFQEFTKEIISQTINDLNERNVLINKQTNNFQDTSIISEILQKYEQNSNNYIYNNYEITNYPIFTIEKLEYSEESDTFKIKTRYDSTSFFDISEQNEIQFYLATLAEFNDKKIPKILFCEINKIDKSESSAIFDCEFDLNNDENIEKDKIYLLKYNLPYYMNNYVYNSGIIVKENIKASIYSDENLLDINDEEQKQEEKEENPKEEEKETEKQEEKEKEKQEEEKSDEKEGKEKQSEEEKEK
jgi:hypothetical protein